MKRSACLLVIALGLIGRAGADQESDYYRIVSVATSTANTDSRSANWKPSDDGIALEVSGIVPMGDDHLAVAIRKGEVWILGGVYDDPPSNVTYHRFASALHEPLGLAWHDGSLVTTQRTEVTALRDVDGDDVADHYDTLASGWGVTGHYHEYAYGPKVDGRGNLWITLNIGLGLKGDQLSRTVKDPILGYRQGKWRGWGMRLSAKGDLVPVCAGMRSPSGIGANAAGDMFYTDQQGNWVATNSLHHMREGAFFHHPESLASMGQPGSPIADIEKVPNGLPLPAALAAMESMKPPAVWFPYKKAGQSATDIMLIADDKTFGPFAGQFLVGEFTQAAINRVSLEKVNGEYQGAVFPFRSGFASAVLRLAQGADGSVFVGLTNRGWSSLGTASYGLERLVWTGKTPLEVERMHARSDGFEIVFTKPVDPETASRPNAYQMQSYTYLYHSTYGSDEIQNKTLTVQSVTMLDDRRVHVKVDGLRAGFVHELTMQNLRSLDGHELLHRHAYYTLNQIPAIETDPVGVIKD